MTVAVITIVAGRAQHLRNQQIGLARSGRLPDLYVVVAMGDAHAVDQTRCGPMAVTDCRIRTRLLDAPADLPLAAARNAGAAEALAAGADRLIFLDVDCVPSPSLIDSYARSLASPGAPALHCGVVRYLGPEVDLARTEAVGPLGVAHPARPRPESGQILRSDDWALFWSLSFAVAAPTWQRIGGFDEAYVGYGAEDTDFGFRAHRLGIDLVWTGGADAYHQYHPTSPLPTQHLDDILRNAGIFHRRWGFWPMSGWLDGFAAAGLARFDQATDRWVRAE
ncbi:Glycosyltransferase, GT2 family [Nakamurella panacisegetis]|uniref:Glycosyltransferase, GT2 family n=1 Tax=Nakamurella panacisegetis TaxID=1090615 RepID=A0A1H0SB88_9ACTN|nr:galactosyltransferase-related protein [Nakamurella panacisegetis]SDP38947.1 Glycosyltransferase, GT2 family [Nakamurella panacisegetis]